MSMDEPEKQWLMRIPLEMEGILWEHGSWGSQNLLGLNAC